MSAEEKNGPTPAPGRSERQLSEPLRAAVARTLETTAGPAAETRERITELLDELARRGEEARGEITRTTEQLARAGLQAREGIAQRGQEAGEELIRRMRELGLAGAEEIDALRGRVAALEERVATLEGGSKVGSDPDQDSKSQVEG